MSEGWDSSTVPDPELVNVSPVSWFFSPATTKFNLLNRDSSDLQSYCCVAEVAELYNLDFSTEKYEWKLIFLRLLRLLHVMHFLALKLGS
jgi:hypothetical protein